MQSQTVNNHAKCKYAEFDAAINTVRLALDELDKFTKNADNGKGKGRFHGWQVPSRDEVRGTIRTASHELDALRKAALHYKAELIARGWRV
jgi:hypothetical protein